MSLKYVVAAALVLGFAAPAAADDSSQFVIIKDANKHCRVVEKNLVSGAFSFGEPSPSTTVLLVWGFRIEALKTRRCEMTQANTLVASAAVIALTLGIGGQTPTPVQQEEPLSTDDILIVTNEAAPQAGQTDESAEDSAKMGKQEGTQSGESQGDVPKSKTDEAPPY